METAKNIYELELHETLHAPMKWDLRTDIMRVPGGWIYQPIIRDKLGRDTYHPATFVPFNNEFQEKTEYDYKGEPILNNQPLA